MDVSLVNPEAITLLSQVTGRDLKPQDLSPTLLFLAALVTVMLGVIVIDRKIDSAEQQRLQVLLESFVTPDHSLYPLIQEMIHGIERQQVYLNPQQVLNLATPLSEPERLLLIALGYEMAASDGEVDARETMYLRAIAHRLDVHVRHISALENGFSHQEISDPEALIQIRALLNPSFFKTVELGLSQVANNLLAALPTLPSTMDT
ncbi:TerB family tellurite resistance protein [Oculatella sp. FACHB-28]|uniref:TerB family tellurite resistance protein n=1 Tax=Oculatella sp. FACHB-28 TaxID=2692845 RepID=UPI001687B384|nr:TerB family tellurite resistance protein [Oculatella sp. FACHB-28]MBD1869250.1 TerB family tellurite resistance protein [Cyanobacteria bacterium FACHB-471]MBD2054926.1 TerB family tellurite resistance protein [Oculatella sp. FACHB-28]